METLETQADRAASRGEHRDALGLLEQALSDEKTNFDLWVKLAAVRRATGDEGGALTALDGALEVRPRDFSALLMRATTLFASGDRDRAGEAYGRALAQAPAVVPSALEPVLAIAGQRYRAWQERQAERLRNSVSHGAPIATRVNAMIEASLRLAPPERDGPMQYCYPGLPAIGFYGRARFPWITTLEAKVASIANEFADLAIDRESEKVPYIRYPAAAPLDQWRDLNNNPDWSAIHLIDRGRVIEANARRCPVTMAVLGTLPRPMIAGAEPNAMFSILAPGTHIPPHTGIANFRLVCHLPLIVPEGCWFRVGDERRTWEVGKAWVFDDTIEHEAMNASSLPRVVLITDIWHPDLAPTECADIAAVVAAGGSLHGP